jgi:hypothetical protein
MILIASPPQATQVTIYNQGFALVKETRTVDLRAGRQQVAIEDVAEKIEPTSVGIRATSGRRVFELLEQNYRYDLISVQAILSKAVGGRVAFNRALTDGRRERIEGVLLSAPTAVVGTMQGEAGREYTGMVLRTDDGRILLSPSGEVEVAALPEGLISRPSLLWDLQVLESGSTEIELSYLTQGIRWEAAYVLTLDGSGKGGLRGWVTLDNQSGATYRDATLKLLAGDVARAREETVQDMLMQTKSASQPRGFQQEQFAEYHLYTLGRPATVRDREIKQVSLLEADAVPVSKRLVIDAMMQYRGWQPQEGEVGTGPIRPQVRIEFMNDKKSNLGMPLPMGKFKVFQLDSSGSLQMLGEDRIDHTPRDERVSLVVGRAFDILAERKRLSFEYITGARGPVGARETFSIELRNRKETPEQLVVIERFWGQWQVTNPSSPFKKLDANTVEFVVDVPAGSTKKLTFGVETRWR